MYNTILLVSRSFVRVIQYCYCQDISNRNLLKMNWAINLFMNSVAVLMVVLRKMKYYSILHYKSSYHIRTVTHRLWELPCLSSIRLASHHRTSAVISQAGHIPLRILVSRLNIDSLYWNPKNLFQNKWYLLKSFFNSV